jgi:hypothetical protein
MENISPADKNQEYPVKDEKTLLEPGPDGKIHPVEVWKEEIEIERAGRKIKVMATAVKF